MLAEFPCLLVWPSVHTASETRSQASAAITCSCACSNAERRSLDHAQGCAGTYFRNSFAGNGKGSVLVDALADLDTDSLASSNKLDRPAVLL